METRSDPPIELSIIVPVRNGEATIAELLGSISRSSIGVPHEVVVVLDRCDDDTEGRCEGYPDVRVLRSPHPGAGPTRHFGALNASGAVLVFVDADTECGRTTFRDMYEMFVAHDRDVALTGQYTKDPLNAGPLASFLPLKWYYTNTVKLLLDKGRELVPICDFGGAPAMISRDNYMQSGGFEDLRYRMAGGEEWEAANKISAVCPIYFSARFNVPQHSKSVFAAFFPLIKRTYNYVLFHSSLDEAGRQRMNFAVPVADKIKLVLLFVAYLTSCVAVFVPVVWPAILLTLLAYLAVDWHFLRFLWREKGVVYLPIGILQDWVALTAKGLGVLSAYFSLVVLRKGEHRF